MVMAMSENGRRGKDEVEGKRCVGVRNGDERGSGRGQGRGGEEGGEGCEERREDSVQTVLHRRSPWLPPRGTRALMRSNWRIESSCYVPVESVPQYPLSVRIFTKYQQSRDQSDPATRASRGVQRQHCLDSHLWAGTADVSNMICVMLHDSTMSA